MAKKNESKAEKVVVKWRGNEREFSLGVHGDDFRDLATSFAEKFGGEVVEVE